MTFLWRSLLYVPAHVEKFVANPKAAAADAIILDLEDSVPEAAKADARAGLSRAIGVIGQTGPDILVRINAGPLRDADVAVAVQPGVTAIVAPKVASATDLRALERRIASAEAAQNLAPQSVRIVVLIETAAGYLDMAAIANASPRVVAINMGAEDFAQDVGMEPGEDTLAMPRQQMAIVAAAAGIMPLGLMGPMTRFDDLDAYRQLAERSRRFGYVGASCIHPSQIAILNTAFSPTPEAVAWAERVIAAAAEARDAGRGAVALEGRMIDAPIVARAEAVLARHSLTNTRQRRSRGGGPSGI
jgi:citrate lyase subunit beta/citryl-CoA lyase